MKTQGYSIIHECACPGGTLSGTIGTGEKNGSDAEGLMSNPRKAVHLL